MGLFKICPVFSIPWVIFLKTLPKRCEHRSEQCAVLSRTNPVSGFVAQVEREKEPAHLLFGLAFFNCSGMTASRKTEHISTKMGMGGVQKYNSRCFLERQWKYGTGKELFWLPRELNTHWTLICINACEHSSNTLVKLQSEFPTRRSRGEEAELH